jgi:hypothetical protein
MEEVADSLRKCGFSVFVAIPCYGCKMTARTATSLLKLQALFMQARLGLHVQLMGNESLITRARNILVAQFLKSPATHLLFIDADIAFNPETVLRLAHADKDIVGAVYPKKSIDWALVKKKLADRESTEPVQQMGLDFNINVIANIDETTGFAEVLDTATGFMMISRTCLETMSERYADLVCVNDIAGSRELVPEYATLFDCIKCPDTRRYLSEDYAFCRRAQKAGFKIHADLASPLGHAGSHVYAGDVSKRYKLSLSLR